MKWPKRHHIGGATTRAHGAKDLEVIVMDEDRIIRELHEADNKKVKEFEKYRRDIEE